MSFQDLFSRQAHLYARYRPRYPDALYSYVVSLVPARRLAWDCATGNGQAALGLAPWFDHVVATDGSAQQLEHAVPHPRVEYRCATAYDSHLESASVDLITVATAVHWFDLPAFFTEAQRVLRPDGIIAVWSYYHGQCGEPTVDGLFRHYAQEIVWPYFADGMQWVVEDYRTLPFPFTEHSPPAFTTDIEWDRAEFLGYLSSWSATQTYVQRTGENPIERIRSQVEAAWPNQEERKTWRFKLFMRVGHR